jgi:hypothetical protein
LEVGESVEDLVDVQVPVFALGAHPVIEGRGSAQREALQEFTTRKIGGALKLGKQATTFVFGHAQSCTGRRVRHCPGFLECMKVEVERGGEIQAEGVTLDEEMRSSIGSSALIQQLAQMEQANTQGCPAMPRVTLWPELFGEGLARINAAFHCQIDKQGQFLARGE